MFTFIKERVLGFIKAIVEFFTGPDYQPSAETSAIMEEMMERTEEAKIDGLTDEESMGLMYIARDVSSEGDKVKYLTMILAAISVLYTENGFEGKELLGGAEELVKCFDIHLSLVSDKEILSKVAFSPLLEKALGKEFKVLTPKEIEEIRELIRK